MPLPNSVATGALVAGTVFAALGLNLGVLGLNEQSSSTATGAEPEPVEKIALTLAAESPTSSAPATESGPDQEQREPAPSTMQPLTAELPSTTASEPNPPIGSVPVSTEYRTIEFEGVASIIIAIHDRSRLEFWSADPSPGWAYLIEDDQASKVKLKFRPKGGGEEAEFAVTSRNGEIKIKREY